MNLRPHRTRIVLDEQLTLRDLLAAAVLPAIYANMTQLTCRAAELAYEQADEMLKARMPKETNEPGT